MHSLAPSEIAGLLTLGAIVLAIVTAAALCPAGQSERFPR
jgi:hypothetical protein